MPSALAHFEFDDDIVSILRGNAPATTSEPQVAKGSLVQMQPRLICVGTGRDGTQSTCHIIQSIFDATDGRRAAHEYASREFSQAFCAYQMTGDARFAGEIRRLIIDCPYDCIVGNGYAAILPFFREQWGPSTKLVHLRRADRTACVDSLIKNSEMFPAAYRDYSSAADATIERMTAFHFGEMSKDEWTRLPIVAKFEWYYDKTHSLVEQHRHLFADYVQLATETLSSAPARSALVRVAGVPDAPLPPPTRLNSHTFGIDSVAEEKRDKAIWLLGRLNWELLMDDDIYAIKYFLNKFVAWAGYQIGGTPQLGRSRQPSAEERAATLSSARAVVAAALKDIEDLERQNTSAAAAIQTHKFLPLIGIRWLQVQRKFYELVVPRLRRTASGIDQILKSVKSTGLPV